MTGTNVLDFDLRHLDAGRVLVDMRGKLNEYFDPKAILHAVGQSRVVLRMANVRHVSSVGVREFEHLIDQLRDVSLVEVSAAVASHLVLMPTLGTRVKVESAQLPFVCYGCSAEQLAVVPFRIGAAVEFAPQCACGRRMVLDGLAEQLLPSA